MRVDQNCVTFGGAGTKNLAWRYLLRICISLATWSLLAISGILATSVSAQEVLPFPPQASGSTAGRT
ncbi:MAG: hypothetical protein WA193_05315, partial [Candidatus Acidiferrales bacterium]